MKIVVDAMGGDNAPSEIVKGAIMAAKEFKVEIILVGRAEEILKSLERQGFRELPSGIEIANAGQVVGMEDDPATVIKAKKDSSLAVGLRLLKDGGGDAFVSAGNTGALLSGATLLVKRIRGIRRAAMAPLLPNRGGGVLLIDCGANVECTGEYLLQFAFMGAYYAKSVLHTDNPRVGLLNIGTEPTKGTPLCREAHTLLREAGEKGRIHFIGNVEARDVLLGDVDVVVADGFSGNILLKTVEGSAIFMAGEMKKIFLKNILSKLAGVLVRPGVREFKKKLNAEEVGGTALLGISKPVIKAHGNSGAYALKSAVRQAIDIINSKIIADIENNIESIALEQ